MTPIKLIALDVDGTLTDGTVDYDPNSGNVHKRFHVADGLGIVMAQRIGIRIAVLTGRGDSNVLQWRMEELGVTDVVQNVRNKADALRTLMTKYALETAEIAFVGDDLNDLPAFETAGFAIAVANASESVKARACFITQRCGGYGGVRDAIEEILRRQNQYEQAVDAYLEYLMRSEKTSQ